MKDFRNYRLDFENKQSTQKKKKKETKHNINKSKWQHDICFKFYINFTEANSNSLKQI